MKLLNATVFAAMAALMAGEASAGLEWKKSVVEVSGMKTDRVLTGNFEYANRGDRPVRILSAKTTCGCTVANPSQGEVAPGEGGNLEVAYTVASKVGYYEAIVTVQTDDPSARETKLAFRIRVRDEVEMSPRVVVWSSGEPPDAKVVSVVPGDGRAFEKIEVESSNDAVSVKTERRDQGFDLSVTPADGVTSKRGVMVVTAYRDGKALRPMRLHYRVH